MVQNLQNFLLPKLICIAILFQQTCITKCMCSHCLARCSSEHNLILHLAKTRKITKSFDCHKCCTWARWITASESDTVEVPKCGTGFPHEKWPPFWGSSKLIFLKQKIASCINRPWWCNSGSASWPWQCWSSRKINKIHLRALTRNFDYSHTFQKMALAVRQNIESQLYVSKQSNRPRIKKQKNSSALDELNSNWSSYNSKTWPWQIKRDRWKGRSMEKTNKNGERNRWVALGCANSRLRPEPRHAFKFAKFHSEKGPSKNILQRKCLPDSKLIPFEAFALLGKRKWSFQRQNQKWRLKTTKCLL